MGVWGALGGGFTPFPPSLGSLRGCQVPDLFPAEAELLRIEEKYEDLYNNMSGSGSGDSGLQEQGVTLRVDDLAKGLIHDLMEVLQRSELKSTCYCYKCERECPLWPPDVGLSVAGVRCPSSRCELQ